MGIFNWKRNQKREWEEGLSDTTETSTDSAKKNEVSKGSSYLERIIKTGNEESSLTIAAVYRAAQVRAESLALMRMRFMEFSMKDNCFIESKSQESNAINYLLQVQPNKRQNAFDFWDRVERMRIFYGHCYILPRYDYTGNLTELIPCWGAWDNRANVYLLTETDFNINGEPHPADEVIVLKSCATRTFPEGESIIHYAARTQNLNATIEALNLENAAKGGRLKLILQQKENGGLAGIGGLDPEEMQKQVQRLQNSIASDDVIWDDSVSNITPINMNAVDLQLLDTRKFSVADIARFFGVPRNLLMDDSNSSYTTPEAATLEFKTRTLTPIKSRIECEFNAKLLTPSEFGTRCFLFDDSALIALDTTAKANYNKNRLETGVASVNDLRKESNMPRVDNGDDHYVSCNVAPVGSAKLSGNNTNNGGTDNGHPEN